MCFYLTKVSNLAQHFVSEIQTIESKNMFQKNRSGPRSLAYVFDTDIHTSIVMDFPMGATAMQLIESKEMTTTYCSFPVQAPAKA